MKRQSLDTLVMTSDAIVSERPGKRCRSSNVSPCPSSATTTCCSGGGHVVEQLIENPPQEKKKKEETKVNSTNEDSLDSSDDSSPPDGAIGTCGTCNAYVGSVGYQFSDIKCNIGTCHMCKFYTCEDDGGAIVKPSAFSIPPKMLTLKDIEVRQPEYNIGEYDREFVELLEECVSLFGFHGRKNEASDEEFEAAIRVICLDYYGKDEVVVVDRATGDIDEDATYDGRKFLCKECVDLVEHSHYRFL